MKRVFAATRVADAQAMLDRLEEMGVVHLTALGPAESSSAEAELSRAEAALGRLASIRAAPGPPPDVEPATLVDELHAILSREEERGPRRAAIERRLAEIAPWGRVRRQDLEALAAAGAPVALVLAEAGAEIPSGATSLGDRLYAVVPDPGPRPGLVSLPWPEQGRDELEAERAAIDAAARVDAERLAALAKTRAVLEGERDRLRAAAEWAAARAGGLESEALFAVAGFVPAGKLAELERGLAGLAAVVAREPTDEEAPPTELHYPRWTRSVLGLFDLLGTRPGYRELDLGPLFMVAMPVFAAMLISDAVYGLALLLGAAIARRFWPGRGLDLLVVSGFATAVFGVLSANYAGVSPETIARWAGRGSDVGAFAAESGGLVRAMLAAAPLYPLDERGVPDASAGRDRLILLSFVVGTLHLVAGRVARAAASPGAAAWVQIGWILFLVGMLLVIARLFFPAVPLSPMAGPALLGAGAALFVPLGARGKAGLLRGGIAQNILPMLSAFSDTMSYLRLMAVGLASQYIASSFNLLGERVAEASHLALAVPVLLFGHGLNLGLCAIALFAHGVRLNMLELSSQAGVTWAGYPYAPFGARRTPCRPPPSSSKPGSASA